MIFRDFYFTIQFSLLYPNIMWKLIFYTAFRTNRFNSYHQNVRNISEKYSLQQNIAIICSFAKGFFRIITVENINDLNDVCSTNRSIPSSKGSQQLPLSTTIF